MKRMAGLLQQTGPEVRHIGDALIGDLTSFKHNGVTWQGTVIMIYQRGLLPDILFVAVVGYPQTLRVDRGGICYFGGMP